jgi:hypothetical protein
MNIKFKLFLNETDVGKGSKKIKLKQSFSFSLFYHPILFFFATTKLLLLVLQKSTVAFRQTEVVFTARNEFEKCIFWMMRIFHLKHSGNKDFFFNFFSFFLFVSLCVCVCLLLYFLFAEKFIFRFPFTHAPVLPKP